MRDFHKRLGKSVPAPRAHAIASQVMTTSMAPWLRIWQRSSFRLAEAQARMLVDLQDELWQCWLAMAGLAPAGQERESAALRDSTERLVAAQGEWAQAWAQAQDDGGSDAA